MSQRGVVSRPVQPLVALRAVRRLLAHPDETALVFQIIRALSGKSFERLYQRVLRDPTGSVVLNERRNLLPLLQDRERLRALPAGTLGREYARFLDTENISAEGLVEASNDAEDGAVFLDDRARVLSNRLRDTHDLWHVVTGYQRDLFGEGALLAFSYAQTRNPGIGFIVVMAALRRWREGHTDAVRLSWQAWRRGRRANSFVAADWEGMLVLPLGEVRTKLGIDEPREYRTLFSAAAAAAH
ncbi:MAG TPA: Coq4 family protein [Candidatus Binatia bacterium]|jgi:ubiquinone biosynthesis protein COQ4